jgi:hypothetical protein
MNEDWVRYDIQSKVVSKFVVGTQDRVVDRFSVAGYWGNPDVETVIGKGHIDLVKAATEDDDTVIILRRFIASIVPEANEGTVLQKPASVAAKGSGGFGMQSAQTISAAHENVGAHFEPELREVLEKADITRLQASFSNDIAGCVQHDVMLTHLPVIDTPTAPSYTTVTLSGGSSFGLRQEKIVLYSIKVEAISQKEIRNCRGHLMTISRGDRVWDTSIILSFTPFEKKDESADKIIFPKVPEFLNIFFITEHNTVSICSYLNLPNNKRWEHVFEEIGVYILRIAISAADCDTETMALSFNWTGDVNTATVSPM